ncbi:hypothetical protein FHR92_003669 [Fontibacillus solani]|uniref:Uncharacterized protein n=1 Tax=Fontibacillus solani TaxID=1572857 RepID=A0A7W3SVW5_9BACL|nr:hypothetical protein [Fontibacillus solani]
MVSIKNYFSSKESRLTNFYHINVEDTSEFNSKVSFYFEFNKI